MDNSVQQEAWNMATQTLKRLSRSLDLCSLYSSMGDMVMWYTIMLDLKRNIYPFLINAEVEAINKKFSEFPKNWVIKGKVDPKYIGKVYELLDEIYLLIIKNMKEKGLLMPKSKNAKAAVLDY